MRDYFNLSIEERKALANKRNERPANFAKTQSEPMIVEEEPTVEEPFIEETLTEEDAPVKKSKKSKK